MRASSPAVRWLRHFVTLLVILLVAAGIYVFWPRASVNARSNAFGAKGAGAKNSRGGRSGEGVANPVVAVRAKRGNIGVYFTGLGTVTPIYTVTVRSRVDGELMSVLYREGDIVHKGDALMEIDPRPFQAQLTQYEGQLLKDQAALANARIDLGRYETLLK